MVSVLFALVGSLVGVSGVLVAYDPTPLCDFRDANRPTGPLDGGGMVVWRLSGLLAAVVGALLVGVAFAV